MTTVFGGNEGTNIHGGKHNDFLRGQGGNDNIRGGEGDDRIFGDAGRDSLYGNEGNDDIQGGKGNDHIFGGDGKDRITGGQGDDTLRGDSDKADHYKDTFVFGHDSGKDVILDFDVDRDVLEITKGLNHINSAKDVLKHASQHGDDVIINLGGGNKITLKNVDLDDLKKHPGDHFDIV